MTRTRILPGDGDPRHGTINGYCNLRCRCVECRAAWAAYIADRRRRRVPPPSRDARHGRTSTYVNYGCRCEICRADHAAYARELRALRAGEVAS